ncbi:MAG: hypothetical protein JKY50_22620 [Oleispira sp.]|nr:hypothetical protein [Oleispira sp.]
MDLRLRIKSESDIHSKFKQLQKDNEWTGQAAAMHIFRAYFNKLVPVSNVVLKPVLEVSLPAVGVAPKVDKDQDIIDWVIGRYHLTLPHGTKLSAKGAVRDSVVKRIKSMLKTEDFKTGEHWQAYFNLITQSDWLMGRSGDWKASLTWLLGPKNIVKVLGGEYTSHTATVGAKTKSEVIDDKNKEACMTFVERKREQLRLEGQS